MEHLHQGIAICIFPPNVQHPFRHELPSGGVLALLQHPIQNPRSAVLPHIYTPFLLCGESSKLVDPKIEVNSADIELLHGEFDINVPWKISVRSNRQVSTLT